MRLMRLMGLDLSTKTGWSIVDDGKLICFGTVVEKPDGNNSHPSYPHNYIECAKTIARRVATLVRCNLPEMVIIEETNKGKNRFSQKLLEFIHYAINESLREFDWLDVSYIDTSAWRKAVAVDFNDDEMESKKDLRKAKSSSKEEVRAEAQPFFEEARLEFLAFAKNKREVKKRTRLFNQMMDEIVRESMSRKRMMKDGKRLTNLSKKHVAVRRVNEMFHTNFDIKDNDICDSICLCVGYNILRGEQDADQQSTKNPQDRG